MLAETKSESLVLDGPIADALRTQLELDDDVLRKLEQIDQGILAVKGEVTIEIPVKNGYGEWTSPTLPTFWYHAKGTVEILEPKGHAWFVKVTDTVAGKTIFNGVIPPGQKMPYDYKTGFTARFHVTVSCGVPLNTTLKARITF